MPRCKHRWVRVVFGNCACDENGMPTRAYVECSGCREPLDGFATLLVAHAEFCEIMALCTDPEKYPASTMEELGS